MKTNFFSLFLLLAVCITSGNAKSLHFPTSFSVKNEAQASADGGLFKIKFHYERGHRNEAGICQDRGVCDLSIDIDLRTYNPGDLVGEIKKDRAGNIFLVIEKNGMDAEAPVDITGFAEGPGTFFLSNNADLPTAVKTQLGLPAKYQFKAGNYQVTETATTYTVNFGKK
jgi:hypothetical protein